jgi:putative MFS transporter
MMLDRSGVQYVFLSFGVTGIIGALVVLLLAVETKGKILEEIAR